MLKIRREQMQAFDDESLQRFENEMWEHCQKLAPQMCKTVKEENVRIAIRMGIKNAEAYGFTNRGPVRFYIELMFFLGCEFDTDPQHVWCKRHLLDQELSQTSRSENLFENFSFVGTKIFGEDNEVLCRSLQKLLQLDFEQFAAVDSETATVDFLAEFFPERIHQFGRSAIHKLVNETNRFLQKERLDSSSCLGAVCCLLTGHRCLRDPLYPWIGNTLRQNPGKSDNRVDLLYRKARRYLESTVAHLKRESQHAIS